MDLIKFKDTLSSTKEETLSRHKRFINPIYASMLKTLNLDRIFVRAQGIYLWDENDRRYFDFTSNFGAVSIGHNHPRVLETIEEYFRRGLPTFCRMASPVVTTALAENLARITPGGLEISYFCMGGTEANEAAIKLAKIVTRRSKILYASGGYHGKTLGALSVMGFEEEKKYFAPLLPGCQGVPYGRIEPLYEALKTGDFAAFIVEPLQSHGGVIIPPDDYLPEVRALCKKFGTLLILDEIATGFGRTGKMFAADHFNIDPDIMTLGKGLSGGVTPIGACITTRHIWEKAYGTRNRYLLHTCTFGDNNFASAMALATLEIIQKENLIENAARMGEYFLQQLKSLQQKHSVISDVRGRGLLVGIEFDSPPRGLMEKVSYRLLKLASEKLVAFWIVSKLLNDFDVLTIGTLTNSNFIRVVPPLIIRKEQIDYFVQALGAICHEVDSYRNILKSSALTILKNTVLKSESDPIS